LAATIEMLLQLLLQSLSDALSFLGALVKYQVHPANHCAAEILIVSWHGCYACCVRQAIRAGAMNRPKSRCRFDKFDPAYYQFIDDLRLPLEIRQHVGCTR
jgi:hypothetical protein